MKNDRLSLKAQFNPPKYTLLSTLKEKNALKALTFRKLNMCKPDTVKKTKRESSDS